jgi:hypothetical protein
MTLRVRMVRRRPPLRRDHLPHNVQTFLAVLTHPKTNVWIWCLCTTCRDLEKMHENHNSLPDNNKQKQFFLGPLCKSDLAFPNNTPENAFTRQQLAGPSRVATRLGSEPVSLSGCPPGLWRNGFARNWCCIPLTRGHLGILACTRPAQLAVASCRPGRTVSRRLSRELASFGRAMR